MAQNNTLILYAIIISRSWRRNERQAAGNPVFVPTMVSRPATPDSCRITDCSSSVGPYVAAHDDLRWGRPKRTTKKRKLQLASYR